MQFFLVFGRTFMILREIVEKKIVNFHDRNGPPLQYWVKNHRLRIQKFSQKNKCTLVLQSMVPSKVSKCI